MTQPVDQLAALVETLQRRVETLETRCTELERALGSQSSSVPCNRETAPDDFSVRLAGLQAMNDYSRLERTEEMRAEPQRLAAVRARRVRVNAFLAERGLPPLADPYPDLP